jgi:hypothetical protein
VTAGAVLAVRQITPDGEGLFHVLARAAYDDYAGAQSGVLCRLRHKRLRRREELEADDFDVPVMSPAKANRLSSCSMAKDLSWRFTAASI